MTALVDFLPASYRLRRLQRRARRQLAALVLLVLGSVVITDVMFRARIAGVRRMERLAIEHVDLAKKRAFEVMALEQKKQQLKSELAQWTAPLTGPTLSQILDELLATRPPGIEFRALHCELDPWSETATPELRLDAGCHDLNEFSVYLAAIRQSAVLPAMRFKTTNFRPADGSQSFRLESEGVKR